MDRTWKQLRLGDVITLQRGFDLPHRDRHDGSIPIVSSSGITGYHDTARVSGPGVVTGRYGTLGEVFYVPEDFWPLNTTLFVRDFKGNDPRFISYFLRTLNLASQDAAGAVPGVNRNALHLLPVLIPPLATQRKIAGILSAYDDLIENNTRRIAILEEMAQALYREWFVHFRFPGHEQVPLVESALGPVPEGWETRPLGELVTPLRQQVQPDDVDPLTPYIGLEHMPRRSIALAQWGEANEVQSAKLIFRKGDILFGKIRPYFHKVGVAPVDGVCSTDAIVVRAKQPQYFPLVLCCMASDDFISHATQTSQGTKMPRANWDVLQNYPIPIPPDELLDRFNSLVLAAVAQIQNMILRTRNLSRTRDLLLPRLVSGEVSAEDLDIADGMADEQVD